MHSLFLLPRAGCFLSIRAALLLIAVGAFSACDRHSATEVPENYGHGSSHERANPDHQADSRGERHFSDTAGMKDEEAGESHEKPAPSPTPSPANRVL